MGTKSARNWPARSCGRHIVVGSGGAFAINGGAINRAVPENRADGRTITQSFNADNEMAGQTWVNPSGGTPLDVFNYGYNADGDLTSVSDDNGAYQYTYNADDEETS